jgi:hypothetical protein
VFGDRLLFHAYDVKTGKAVEDTARHLQGFRCRSHRQGMRRHDWLAAAAAPRAATLARINPPGTGHAPEAGVPEAPESVDAEMR